MSKIYLVGSTNPTVNLYDNHLIINYQLSIINYLRMDRTVWHRCASQICTIELGTI